MLPKKHFPAKLSLLYVSAIFLFLFILVQQSCKKTDTQSQSEIAKVEIDPSIKFFNLSANVNPSVIEQSNPFFLLKAVDNILYSLYLPHLIEVILILVIFILFYLLL